MGDPVPDFPGINDAIGTLLAISSLIGVCIALGRWVVRRILPQLREKHATQQAINEVLLGRPAIPANTITGEQPKPAVPSIGQQVAQLRERVEDIHHEVHPNGGGSMRDDINTIKARQASDYDRFAAIDQRLERFAAIDARLARIEATLAEEMHTAHDALANAGEASREALSTIHDAIKAQPPES